MSKIIGCNIRQTTPGGFTKHTRRKWLGDSFSVRDIKHAAEAALARRGIHTISAFDYDALKVKGLKC